jgi:hypothetical protein
LLADGLTIPSLIFERNETVSVVCSPNLAETGRPAHFPKGESIMSKSRVTYTQEVSISQNSDGETIVSLVPDEQITLKSVD